MTGLAIMIFIINVSRNIYLYLIKNYILYYAVKVVNKLNLFHHF